MLTSLSIALFISPQEVVPQPHPSERAIARLEQFDAEEQAEMVADIMSFVWDCEHPKLAATRQLLLEYRVPGQSKKDPYRHYEADKYAPALRLKTRIRRADSRSWGSFAEDYRAQAPAFDLRSWQWSSGLQQVVGPEKRLDSAAQVRALATGELPEFGLWTALLESKLDNDKQTQALSDYFEHSYRNRRGDVYEGLTLGQMWSSQREFGISDVEAIAYLREIHGETGLKSPIPGSKHNRLYDRIKASYAQYREYHQIRRALAVVYFDPQGPVPLIMSNVAPRLDLAWALAGDDPERMCTWLEKHTTRKSFLASVEEEIAKQLEQGQTEEAMRNRGSELGAVIAQRTMEGLRREGLLGLRGR